jgi:hypothetical protein
LGQIFIIFIHFASPIVFFHECEFIRST